jgi:hypothetical protein
LWIDKDDKQDLELPHQLSDRPATHPPIVQVLNPGEARQLLNRPLTTSPQPFVAEIKFRPLGTGDNGQLEELVPSTAPVLRPAAPPTQPFDPTPLKVPIGTPDPFAPNTNEKVQRYYGGEITTRPLRFQVLSVQSARPQTEVVGNDTIDPNSEIVGQLVDEQGQPVLDTTVYCYSAAKPQTTAEVVTVKRRPEVAR